MPKPSDPRLTVGNIVNTRATLVTCEAECKRLFGSLWKTKRLTGTVVSVQVSIETGRRQKSVLVDWKIQTRLKRCMIKLVSVKAGEPISQETDDVTNKTGGTTTLSPTSVTELQPEAVPANTENRTTEVQGVTATAHDRLWTNEEVMLPLNGSTAHRKWKVIGPIGDMILQNQTQYHMRPYDFFMWMFPQDHLQSIVVLTSKKLEPLGHAVTTGGEILKFFGLLILISRFEFTDRRSLWSKQSASKYIPLPQFGKIMSRKRFEVLTSCITFSQYTATDSCDSRWSHVSGFVQAINQHRRAHVVPAHTLCIDESMSRWYGLGGDWIQKGLPHYVAIDRKPENGCEIKTVCCGVSGILLGLELVLSSEETLQRRYEQNHPHGTAIVLRLTEPWFNSNRLVCADSAFASVTTATTLFHRGLRFTGVIKTATKQYPMVHLSQKELSKRGDQVVMVSKDHPDSPSVMAVLWMDRERRYFVSTAGTTLPAEPIVRSRWRSIGDDAQFVTLTIPIPKVVETYYETCSQIDRHNRCRQDDLNLEKKFQVKDWALRLNTSLLSVCIVDSWLLNKGSMGARDCLTQKDFYAKLADQLIENSFDAISRHRTSDATEEISDIGLVTGTGINLIVTNKKRKLKNGAVSKANHQARCRICRLDKKSKFLCSKCLENGKEVWICHSQT